MKNVETYLSFTIMKANNFNCICQISDFGLSKSKELTMTNSSVADLGGTPTHIPPEKWMNYELELDVKFDVYSFGILLWELCADKMPFANCRSGIVVCRLNFCQFPYIGFCKI